MKKILYSILWLMTFGSLQSFATSIPVKNGDFTCSCTTYAFCEPTDWSMVFRDSANAFCQTNNWMAGGGEVNGGDSVFLLGNGTTTYQDIVISNLGEYIVSYREAVHPGASGTIYLDYLNSTKTRIGGTSAALNFPFEYVKDGGTGELSGVKTLSGGQSPAGTAYVRIRFYGVKGSDGFAKVDDISLSFNAATPQPTISINNVTATEGNSGTKAFTFTVSLSSAYTSTVTVNYTTANGTATTTNYDYAAASGTLTFLAGQTSKTITVNVTGDTNVESDEAFYVNLSGATNATISDSQGLGTIQNDDALTPPPTSTYPTCTADTSGSTTPYEIVWSAFDYTDFNVFKNTKTASSLGKKYNTFDVTMNGIHSTNPLSLSGVMFTHMGYWEQTSKKSSSTIMFTYNPTGGYWESQADDGTAVYIYPISATVNGVTTPWRAMTTYDISNPPSSFYNTAIPASANTSFRDGGTGTDYSDTETISPFPINMPYIDTGTISTTDNKNTTYTFALEYADGRNAFAGHSDTGTGDVDWHGYMAIWYYAAPYDYGDADGYAVAGHGATLCSGALYIGDTRPDTESATQSDGPGTATGDNSGGKLADNNSLTPPNISKTDTVYSVSVPYHNNTGANATLAAWIDFDNDGQLEVSERQKVTVAAGSGSVTLNWTGISVNSSATQLALRLRIASQDSEVTSASGLASNGEVEDYIIAVNSVTTPPIITEVDQTCPVGYTLDTSVNYAPNGDFSTLVGAVQNPNSWLSNNTWKTEAYYQGDNLKPKDWVSAKNTEASINSNSQVLPSDYIAAYRFPGNSKYSMGTQNYLYVNGNDYGRAITSWESKSFTIDSNTPYLFVAHFSNALHSNYTAHSASDPQIQMGYNDGAWHSLGSGYTTIPRDTTSTNSSADYDKWHQFTYLINPSSSTLSLRIMDNAYQEGAWGDDLAISGVGLYKCQLPSFSVSGTVYNDVDHDGIKDSGESGMQQETYVKACKSDNTFIKSVKADAVTGLYNLSLPNGDYLLMEDASNSSDCSTTTDVSGWISTTPNSATVTVNGTTVTNKDFGNFHGSTISGYVFNDLDQDGHFDQDTETGMANIDLLIKRCGENEFDTTSTDANGHYTFWVPVGVQGDYAVDNWVGVFEKNSAGKISTDSGFSDDYLSTGDEFNHGTGTQSEPSNGSNTDHNWLCFHNISGLDFDNGGYQLVGNNFGNYTSGCDVIPNDEPTAALTQAQVSFDITGAGGEFGSAILNAITVNGQTAPFSELIGPDMVEYSFTYPHETSQYINYHGVYAERVTDGSATFDPALLSVMNDRDLNHFLALDPGDATGMAPGDYIDFKYNTPIKSAGDRYFIATERGGNNWIKIVALDQNGNPIPPIGNTLATGTTSPFYIDTGIDVTTHPQFPLSKTQDLKAVVYPLTAVASKGTPIYGLRVSYNDGFVAGDGGDGKIFIMVDPNKICTMAAQNDDFTPNIINAISGGTTGSVFIDNSNGVDLADNEPATDANIDDGITIIDNGGLTGVTINTNGTLNIPAGTALGDYNLTYKACLAIDSTICDTAISTVKVNRPMASPIAEYRFDECQWDGTADEVQDSSGNLHHGTAYNGANTDSDHIINRSGLFTKSENQYLSVDGLDTVFGDSSSAFTLSAWVKPKTLSTDATNHSTQNTIFAKASDSKNDNFELGINTDGTVHLYLDTKARDRSTNFGNAGDITINAWHYVAVTYENGTVTVKIDDKEYTNTNTWSGATILDQAVGSPFTMGASLHIDNFFDGFVDEVKIYDTALPVSELNTIYDNEKVGKNPNGSNRDAVICTSPTPTPIGEFRFDECSWDGIANEVRAENGSIHGVSKNGADTVPDAAIGRSGYFDGTDDYLDFEDNYDPGATDKWSVSLWFNTKKNNVGEEYVLYNKEGLFIGAIKDGYFKYAIAPHWSWDGGTSFPVSLDTWYHVVVTYDGTNQKIYKNGVEIYSRVQTGNIGSNAASLMIGARDSTTPRRFFEGQIDEFKLFNSTLSANAVQTLYDNESTGKNVDGTTRNAITCSTAVTTGSCYAISTAGKLYTTYLDPGVVNLPEASEMALDFSSVPIAQQRTLDGEAGAYYAKDGQLYAYAESADAIPYLYRIDPSSGAVSYIKEFTGMKRDVHAAAFSSNRFYVAARTDKTKNDGTLYTIDPTSWTILSSININGDRTMVSGLAIGKDGSAYAIIDNDGTGTSRLATIDLNTAKVTYIQALPNIDGRHVGAEGLSFANDGKLYTENSDLELSIVDDKIYQIDMTTGALTAAAQMPKYINPRLDIESLSCNVEVINPPPSTPQLIAEFRFDDCGDNSTWNIDHSMTGNNAIGTPNLIQTDFKSYMCNAIANSSWDISIPDHAAYDIDEGTISILLYDHHTVWNTARLLSKGLDLNTKLYLAIENVGGDATKGTIKAQLANNVIDTKETYFTTLNNGTDNDTQWTHITFSFGSNGMKLYINGELKGTNPYTGGLKGLAGDIAMPALSGYFDEFYIFDKQMNDTQISELYNNIVANKNIDGTLRDCGCNDNTGTLGMLLTRGDGENNAKTNVYAFDVDIPTNTVTNFHLVKKLDGMYRSLVYKDGKFITAGMDGTIYHLDPVTGDPIVDNSYGKIDNTGIMAIDFDENNDILYKIWSADTTKLQNVYKYNKASNSSTVLKNVAPEYFDDGIAYQGNGKYTMAFMSGGGGAKHIDNGTVIDIPKSRAPYAPKCYCVYGGEYVCDGKSYFINAETGDLNMYASEGQAWDKFYDYGTGAEGNTGGLKGMAIAIARSCTPVAAKPNLTIADVEQLEGDEGITTIVIPVTLDKPAPAGGVTINFSAVSSEASQNDFAPEFAYSFFDKLIIDDNDDHNNDDDFNDLIGYDPTNYYHVNYQRYYDRWWVFWVAWTIYERNYTNDYANFEDYYINKLNKTPDDGTDDNNNDKTGSSFGKTSPLSFKTEDTNTTDINNTIVIGEGDSTGEIIIPVRGDTSVEEDESFDIIIESASGAIVVDDNATAIIINDDINLTSGLVAEYRFDECEWTGAAGEVTDSGPNGLHATAMGGAELTAGVLNNAGKFDGSGYIDIPQNSELSLTGDMSMSFWVNPTDQTYSTQNSNENWQQNFIVKGLGAEFRVDFWYDGTDQCLCVMYTHGNDSQMVNPDNDKIYWNQWYHFVLVRDTTAKMVHFYINGVLIDSKPYDSLGIGEPTSQLSGVTLASGTTASKFKGEIDEVKFFDGAMSGGQATEIYNNERNGLNYDGTPRDPITCQEPFTCDETLYISNGSLDGTGAADSTKTWLHSINQSNTPYDFDAIGSGYSANSKGYNAIGYRVTDNYIYALQENRLLKIDKNEIVKELGTVIGLPAKQFYAGEFGQDGYYYAGMEETGTSNTIYQIDIDQVKVVGTITLSRSVRFEDMAEGIGGYFYAMLMNADGTNDQVAKIDPTTGNVTPIGTATQGDKPAIALVYTDIDGDIFMVAEQDSIYKVDTTTGALYEMSSIQSMSDYHDGTSCPDANMTEPVAVTHITDIEKAEGDSGTTTFSFTLYFNRPTEINSGFWVTYTDGVNAVYPIETAGHVDTHTGDEADFDGTARYIVLPVGVSSYEINATVIGDTYVEHHEEFYVDIYAPDNLILMDTRAVGTIINDDTVNFRVERDNSGSIAAPTTDYDQQRKSNMYTQIVKKDFDYSVVSYEDDYYDAASDHEEFPIDDVTLKVDLYDLNTTMPNHKLMATRYLYFPKDAPKSRELITLMNDLAVAHATRRAQFMVSCPVDGNNSIIYGNYSANEADYNQTILDHSGSEQVGYSEPFAIRPLGFNVAISDNLTEVTHNNTTGGKGLNPVSLAAEYLYRLSATAIRDISGTLETEYKTDNRWELQGVLDFDGSTTNCNILESVDLVEENTMHSVFNGGELIGDDFNHSEAGRYIFTLLDINWTHIDQNDTDPELSGCIVDHNNSERIGGKYGCNISSDIENNALFDPIAIEFEPYEFNITNTFVRNANGTDRNYVYMGDLNRSLDMGVEIGGDVIAQGKNHKRLYNFVNGCAAESVNIDLQYLITGDQNLTDSTTYNKILTRNGTQKDFNYLYAFNGNSYSAADIDERLDNNITIPSSAFIKTQEGNSSVSILYNITKDLNEPMNPVKVVFSDLNATSADAASYSNGSDHFIPFGGAETGQLDRSGTGTRFFYYSKVAPYQENYGDVAGTSLNTPVYIAIYCGDMNQSWCSTMINTNGLRESFAQSGWYTAHLHDSSTDGSISQLMVGDPSDSVTDAASLPNFHDGRAGRIEDITTATNHSSLPWRVTVTIDQMSPWLYHHIIDDEGKPFWRVNFKGNSNGVITGVGETGHITEIDANTNYSNSKGGKIDW